MKDIKLVPSMFHDPEPEKPVMIPISDGDNAQACYVYQNKLKEWTKRQVKPERPYSAFTDNSQLAWAMRKQMDNYDEWQQYFEALSYYKAHRLRWEGFEKERNELVFYQHAEDLENLYVVFKQDGTFEIGSEETFSLFMDEPPSIKLFELFCQENGIKLEPKEESK